ncbi:amidohydrolase family protein [Pseudonocardia asaccharolytica]|uniref:Amidohydrolase n=1 Tax=Pseudonocardia asaccharolytica DSM 44247 = NBRC 16224 TaxID=1123024 RepID=A0A511CYY9_9PSEU|nr:amidohydrolase family protein [Pseudonocardia asaccharolytica]GEL17761.1 amidohydrolase [Pseudonocardia asaccharolytica DSM 44247 = NBRC 16224]
MVPEVPAAGYRLRGVLLPSGDSTELFVDGAGRISAEPLTAAETLLDGGWIVPGLVDAHCHIGLGPSGPVELDEAEEQARTDRDAGTLLIRDCGSPVDTSPLQARADLPQIIRAGRHIARPKRYIGGLAVDLDDPALLPEVVAEQAAAGDGWVKLVGDWIDRGVGDLAPLWPDDVLAEAIATAHEAGARVTAHVFGTDALPGLIGAGIDCIEHGTGLTDDLIAEMARRGTALVPTLINVETFPGIAERAAKYPAYAAHMRELHRTAGSVVRCAVEAGVPVFAGTDAGGGIRHGRIVDEILALHAAGHTDAIGAASWAARAWLGRPGLDTGAPADLVVYRSDPRADPAALREPALVLLRGRVVHATG